MSDAQMTAYTPAQLRAFQWLPSDGSWRDKPGREMGGAVNSLCLNYRGAYAEKKGSDRTLGFRLTPSGVAERARLAKEGVIK